MAFFYLDILKVLECFEYLNLNLEITNILDLKQQLCCKCTANELEIFNVLHYFLVSHQISI